MTDHNFLQVWHQTDVVGYLWRENNGAMGFEYDKTWLEKGFPISLQMPLTQQTYSAEAGKAHKFFANLLPEAYAREHIVRSLKISNDDFALLRRIGRECAGALSILPAGEPFDESPVGEPLSSTEFSELLLRRGNLIYAENKQDKPRLSLAGAHDKYGIIYKDDKYYWPTDLHPSTHIVKFELSDYKHIPAYEYFLSLLAKSVSLPVVDCELRKHKKHYFLLVKRYDRADSSNESVARLHQEDFCQALGFSYGEKYQIEGGPSFNACYALLQQYASDPIRDTENLLRWQMFNFLAGNSDGHAKNLSIIYKSKREISLAPFYDLVCTKAISGIDTRLAMSVGTEFVPGKISLTHWQKLAAQCQLRESYVIKLLKELVQNIKSELEYVQTQFHTEHGSYPALQRVTRTITKQCHKVQNEL